MVKETLSPERVVMMEGLGFQRTQLTSVECACWVFEDRAYCVEERDEEEEDEDATFLSESL